jgi:co-chaperonin GroES (HSP10)
VNIITIFNVDDESEIDHSLLDTNNIIDIVEFEYLTKDESNEFLIPVGSEILFDQHKGTPLTLEGENYEVIYFADIMVTL